MARSSKIIIMTDERVKERLQFYADQLGMTISGLGAYILGHWVYQQDRLINPLVEQIKNDVITLAKEEMLRKDDIEQPSEAQPSGP